MQSNLTNIGIPPKQRILSDGLRIALGRSNPQPEEVKAYLRLMEGEGLDAAQIYEEALQSRQSAFPQWGPAPTLDEVLPIPSSATSSPTPPSTPSTPTNS